MHLLHKCTPTQTIQKLAGRTNGFIFIIATFPHIVMSGLDLASGWHCWLTAGTATAISTGTSPIVVWRTWAEFVYRSDASHSDTTKHRSTVKHSLYQHVFFSHNSHSARKKSLLQDKHKKSDGCLQMHKGVKIVIFGDISCGLMRLKRNCLTMMTIVTFGGKTTMLLPSYL